MNLHDPSNRLGKSVPFADTVEDFTMDGARAASCNCPRCFGSGLAVIFSPRYARSPVEIEADSRGQHPVVMRTVAFCICPAGRKVAVLNQQTNKEFFLRVPDLHDVIAKRYFDWVADDPTDDPTEPIDLAGLPEAFERLYQRLGLPQVYYEPDEPRLYVERDYDEPENLAAS